MADTTARNIEAIAALEREALHERVGVTVTIRDTRVEQLLKETDIHQLATALDRELTDKEATASRSAPGPHRP